MDIYCADIGSIRNGNFGWARTSTDSPDEWQWEADIQKLVNSVVCDLSQKRKVALGFECPLWVPVEDAPKKLASARIGEKDHPWSAGAGAASLATGLVQTAWILDKIRRETCREGGTSRRDKFRSKLLDAICRKAPSVTPYLNWEKFEAATSGLFLWEAFVTGKAKAAKNGPDQHVKDAKKAVQTFLDNLKDSLEPVDALSRPERALSLVGAALLWSGWSRDLSFLKEPCIVIRP